MRIWRFSSERMCFMEIEATLSASFLFQGVSAKTAALAARNPAVRFRRGEQIPAGSVGFVLSGCVHAVGTMQEKSPILNTFHAGEFFGMASVFGGACGATCLKAAEPCRILLLSQQALEQLLQADPVFARNYITFLTDKIRFLNRKIAAFTAGSAEKALVRYLLSLPCEGDRVTIPMSLAKLADALCIARSSLYRAFDALEKNDLLRREKTHIVLCSREELIVLYGGTQT